MLLLLLGSASTIAHPQQKAGLPVSTSDLPNAPVPGGVSAQTPDQRSGSISGTVLDINGGIVPDATVTLVDQDALGERVAKSDAEGNFIFTGLSAGTYLLTVASAGLETFVLPKLVLSVGQKYIVPHIGLPIAAMNTDVQVTVTQNEIAQEQLKEAEKQRVFGIIPNFYSSYIWNAAPLSPKQKIELAFRSKTDPVAFAASGITAGLEQASNRFPAYGQDAQGYAKRYGASYANGAISRLIGSAILPSLLHQDPRYFYKGLGSIPSRTLYALSSAVVTRGDNGHRQPNYSRVLGSFAAGGISNLYHPAGDRGAMLTVNNALIGTAADAVSNVVREFLLRGLTPRIPAYANGKP